MELIDNFRDDVWKKAEADKMKESILETAREMDASTKRRLEKAAAEAKITAAGGTCNRI